ncbi:unnamed protein product [Ilex paraguariensis]|uniref:Uncharacterized protein n=1 Tax=Ilex paraguariensis TaxID=185542 RepID=A0ABC8R6Y2_9AQUA
MTNERGSTVFPAKTSLRRPKFGTLLSSDPNLSIVRDENTYSRRDSSASVSDPSPPFSDMSNPNSANASPSPYFMSPWNNSHSPYVKSPWTQASSMDSYSYNDDKLGSDSKNIRVWKNLKDFSGFKSRSGLVKAIVTPATKFHRPSGRKNSNLETSGEE